MSPLRKECLPSPSDFYRDLVKHGRRANSKGWIAADCPFHQSKSGASLSINIHNGGWICWAGCGKGDIVKFVMKRDGLSFREACHRLNCWDSDGRANKSRKRAKDGPLTQMLIMDITIDGIQHRLEILDEPKTELECLRRFRAEARDRLSEIRQGDAERFEGEEETQWSILADSWELIQIEVADGRLR